MAATQNEQTSEKPHASATLLGEKEGEGQSNRGRSSSPLPSPGSSNGRRGRSRTRTHAHTRSDDNLRRRGYHALTSSFGKIFHVEKRWKLIRELGSGAYGFVISAADDISGEPVAIKMVTRALDKVQLAKRVLREITLLRHFAHENITGLIDVDCSPDMNEMHVFYALESWSAAFLLLRSYPERQLAISTADLHQIIRSGQALTNEHVQYFVYQILRGRMKYVHSASVVHRDLKPGNLLVNANCELKICDFGLSRGFNSAPDENPTVMTEYVATRWYRAPEIMLAFKGYNTASLLIALCLLCMSLTHLITVDVWSIGCIMAELMLGKPLFKGKESNPVAFSYVDQLNKILDVLGTPNEEVIGRIASQKVCFVGRDLWSILIDIMQAQAYLRSLPFKKIVPFSKILPTADLQATDLLTRMLTFDPAARITVPQALEHPWLSSYHEIADEPNCPALFERWRKIEQLVTLEDFREALWNEIQDCRKEFRSINVDLVGQHGRSPSSVNPYVDGMPPLSEELQSPFMSPDTRMLSPDAHGRTDSMDAAAAKDATNTTESTAPAAVAQADPVVRYARRSSFMQPSRTNSTYSNHSGSQFRSRQGAPSVEGRNSIERGGESTVAFPTQEYVMPARSRTGSMFSGEVTRRLLRTLSTVSIYESGEGLAGGLADIAPIGKYIVERDEGLPSEMPRELESPPKETKTEGQDKEKSRFHIE
ncbi:Mitogen-activated protein kinase SLT2/MPK1, partial [Grifola frondosa]